MQWSRAGHLNRSPSLVTDLSSKFASEARRDRARQPCAQGTVPPVASALRCRCVAAFGVPARFLMRTRSADLEPATMDVHDADADAFSGSVPDAYEKHMVPLFFQPYAEDLIGRLVPLAPVDVLEVAAGTGAVTREMVRRLTADSRVVATDLNPAMISKAQTIGTTRPVKWRPADAMDLQFGDETFDAVVCQFGVMFFPDRAAGFAEMRRVLRPGGTVLFSVWDRLENNELSLVVSDVAAASFPDDPPTFLARTPFGYHDEAVIRADLERAGFPSSAVRIETVELRSRAGTCVEPALALCQGSPLRAELVGRDPECLARVTEVAADAIAERFGRQNVDAKMQAFVVTATK